MSLLPQLHYVTTGLPRREASEIWSQVIAPLFEPRAYGDQPQVPVGSATGVVINEIIIARVVFNAQDFVRDEARIGCTPDHILFHLYNSGGFDGLVTRKHTTVWSGHVAVIDLKEQVRTRAAASDTVSLIVPRKLLRGLPLEGLTPRLEGRRNRLLAAHVTSLRERSAQITQDMAEETVDQTVAFLHRVLDPAGDCAHADDVVADRTLLTLAEAAVRGSLASPKLSPQWLAAELGISRATLYRLFSGHGGIMRYVQERRLLAVQAALCDPLEMRRLSRLAAEFGFNSDAHFSRSFRTRFGMTARDYRAEQVERAARSQITSPEIVGQWWSQVAT